MVKTLVGTPDPEPEPQPRITLYTSTTGRNMSTSTNVGNVITGNPSASFVYMWWNQYPRGA